MKHQMKSKQNSLWISPFGWERKNSRKIFKILLKQSAHLCFRCHLSSALIQFTASVEMNWMMTSSSSSRRYRNHSFFVYSSFLPQQQNNLYYCFIICNFFLGFSVNKMNVNQELGRVFFSSLCLFWSLPIETNPWLFYCKIQNVIQKTFFS